MLQVHVRGAVGAGDVASDADPLRVRDWACCDLMAVMPLGLLDALLNMPQSNGGHAILPQACVRATVGVGNGASNAGKICARY
jgi:hypothetical protein